MRNTKYLIVPLALYMLFTASAIADASNFADVPADAWYAEAVAFVQENKLMTGYGNNLFGPDDMVTQEQLAIIMQRYALLAQNQNFPEIASVTRAQLATVLLNASRSAKDTDIPEAPLQMNIQIGEYAFVADLEDNQAVRELVEILREQPLEIKMDDYSGFEKVGSLGRSLTASNSQTTTQTGDIVLYNGNNIVMFYGSNSWSYTRLGRVNDLTDWLTALGGGGITAVLSLPEK